MTKILLVALFRIVWIPYRCLYYDVSRNIKSLFVELFEAFSRNALSCNNSQFPYHVFSDNVKGNNIKQIQITSIQIP